MNRTQIYLTDQEREGIETISAQTGQSHSEIIRKAVDEYLERKKSVNRKEAMRQAFGMWKDRTDLPDFVALRKELDRE